MAAPSAMIPLGTKAPAFTLLDVTTAQKVSLADVKSDTATVIMFICNHCPYVKHILTELIHVANEFQSQGVQFIAISANDAEKYPDDSPDNMKRLAKEKHFPFPYLYDDTQSTALAYQAACTPDFYVFDKNLACIYRGRFDASTPGNQLPVTGQDLRAALTAIVAGKAVTADQVASIGCGIKWR